MTTLIHHLRIFRVQIKNNFVREAVYRTNFLTTFIVDLIWVLLEFLFFKWIYLHTPTIAGWSFSQVGFFLGIYFCSDALFSVFLSRNFWTFTDLVNKGELDILLTKPANTLFLFLTRYTTLTALLNVGLGLIVMLKFADEAGFKGGLLWLAVPVWLLLGVAFQGLIRFFFVIWVFWTERGWIFSRLYYNFYTFAAKPDQLYPKVIRYVLLTALPFAFIGSVPARALLEGLTVVEYLSTGAVFLAFYFLNRILWLKALRRYQSASS